MHDPETEFSLLKFCTLVPLLTLASALGFSQWTTDSNITVTPGKRKGNEISPLVDTAGRRDAKRASSLLELRREKLEFGEGMGAHIDRAEYQRGGS